MVRFFIFELDIFMIDKKNRRKQVTRLCQWLVKELRFDSGAALAKALNISQSTMSGILSEKPDAAIPDDDLRDRYCTLLNNISIPSFACDRWTIATFTEYMDSTMEPSAFIKYLLDKPIPIRMSVRDIHGSLTESERFEMLEFTIHDLKKNFYLFACA